MPSADYLDGMSSTRQLARSLLYEVLGMSTVPEMPSPPQRTNATQWTRQDIYDAVCRFIDIHGHMPGWNEWRHASRYGLPARATVQLQWGTCGALLQAVRAGYKNHSDALS